jgi:hypothetical protein
LRCFERGRQRFPKRDIERRTPGKIVYASQLHDYLTPVAEHPEFSDEDILSYRDGGYPVDEPAVRRPVCPNDEHRHGSRARSHATGSARSTISAGAATCRHNNNDVARARAGGSPAGDGTPGDSAGSFAVTGTLAVYGHDVDFDRQDHHEEKEGLANHHAAGGPEVD